jgi:alanine racemase
MPAPNHPPISAADIVRPTRVEVDLGRLTENLLAIRRRVGAVKVMPILKANAYGHGLVEVARHLVTVGVDYLGVGVLEEAILLREQGIQAPILVLGGIMENQIPYFLAHGLTLTASSIGKLQQIDEAAAATGARARVHLKIDTGMERIGVHHYSAKEFLETSLSCRRCEIEGIYSHFASSETADLASARLQLERFEAVLGFYEERGLAAPWRHMANSGAILQLPESHLDMVRPGLLLYGAYPSPDVPRTVPVRPALSWESRVVYFKVVQAGNPVSYGWTWKPDRMVRVVTVPVGYGDGYFRALSNSGVVLIHGRRYPVVGRVCMDQVVVNIDWDSAYNGDEVVLIGESGDESITCEELAQRAGTIPYEVLTNINGRVPRVYVAGSQPSSS